MVGIAVKVTEVPLQIELEEAAIETLGATFELTVIVSPALVAVNGLAQVALEVNTQVITLPLAKDVLVKVAELVPTFTPLFFH